MKFFLISLSLNGWGKSPFNAYSSLILSLAAGEKAKHVFLGLRVTFIQRRRCPFFLPIYGKDGHGWPSSLSCKFRVSERAGLGNFLFFGVGTVHLGGLESRSESLPSDRVAPNHSMIERKWGRKKRWKEKSGARSRSPHPAWDCRVLDR